MSEAAGSIVAQIEAKSSADAQALTVTAEKIVERETEQANRRAKARRDAAGKELKEYLAAEMGLAEAKAAGEAAQMKLHEMQSIVERLSADALKRLAEVPRDDAYLAVFARLVSEAARALASGEAAVFASARDREFVAAEGRFDRIAEAVARESGVKLTLSAAAITTVGGVVLSTPDGRQSYYSTFEEIAYRRRNELRAIIVNQLFE